MNTLKLIRFFCFILFLFFLCIPSHALNMNQKLIKGVAQAYGFILGQEYTLSMIAKQYKDLATAVKLSNAKFESAFPEIKKKLEMQLKLALGEKKFQEMANALINNLQNTLKQNKLTRETSQNFLKKVEDRAKGKIETPVLEYLLIVKYASNPVGEFLDGFRQRYSTDGSGKSQGIKLSLQLPRSWARKEGERPHIVQKWVSENGTGLVMIMLDIRNAEGYNPSKTEIELAVRSGEVRKAIPEGGSYIDSGVFSLEMRTGYWLHVKMLQERVGITLYQESLIYQLFFHGKAIGFLCFAGGPEKDKKIVSETLKNTRPLFQQVLNSLVLKQAY